MVEHTIDVEESLKEGARLVLLGSQNAILGLSEMVDQEIHMTAVSARQVSVDEIPDLFGGREQVAVAVYLAVTGATEGHMFLVYPPQTAMSLVEDVSWGARNSSCVSDLGLLPGNLGRNLRECR